MADHREPKPGDILPGGSVCGKKYARQREWEIWETQNGNALFVSASQAEAWAENGMVEPGLFLPYTENLCVAETDHYELISSADFGPYPKTGMQVESLVKAFVQTRKRFPDARLAHSLYLPQLPFLLTFEGEKDADQDSWILGRWTSGGMNIPFTDRNRIQTWVPGMTGILYDELMKLLNWEETESQPIQALHLPEEPSLVAAVTERRKPRKEEPFTLPGRKELERFFRERIIDVIEREEAYRRMGIFFPGPTLLVGPPGCGKTYAVEKLTEYLGWPSYAVNSESIASKYIHETSRLISDLFKQAMENAPSIVIMDEMEAYLSSRDSGSGNWYRMEEMAEFLRILPELPEKKVLLFGMTNMPDQIDQAIRRKGRFDHVLKVEMPSEEELISLMTSLLKDIPKKKDLDLGRIARKLEGCPVSDVVFVVKEAGRLAVVQEKDRIDDELLQQAYGELRKQDQDRTSRRTIGFQ